VEEVWRIGPVIHIATTAGKCCGECHRRGGERVIHGVHTPYGYEVFID